MSPKTPIYPGPVNVNLFGNGVFAGVIKMRSYWITVGLDPVIGGCEREEGNVDRDTQREGGQRTAEQRL